MWSEFKRESRFKRQITNKTNGYLFKKVVTHQITLNARVSYDEMAIDEC